MLLIECIYFGILVLLPMAVAIAWVAGGFSSRYLSRGSLILVIIMEAVASIPLIINLIPSEDMRIIFGISAGISLHYGPGIWLRIQEAREKKKEPPSP